MNPKLKVFALGKSVLIIGTLFKWMHWPHNETIIYIGFAITGIEYTLAVIHTNYRLFPTLRVLSLITIPFLPFGFFIWLGFEIFYQNITNQLTIPIKISLGIFYILVFIGVLFKLMHWPASGSISIISLSSLAIILAVITVQNITLLTKEETD